MKISRRQALKTLALGSAIAALPTPPSPLESPFYKLAEKEKLMDDAAFGFRRGEVWVMIGGPKTGKSTLAERMGNTFEKLIIFDENHPAHYRGSEVRRMADSGDHDILTVVRRSHAAAIAKFFDSIEKDSIPLICPHDLLNRADWVFVVKPLDIISQSHGFFWAFETVKDRYNSKAKQWAWYAPRQSNRLEVMCWNPRQKMVPNDLLKAKYHAHAGDS